MSAKVREPVHVLVYRLVEAQAKNEQLSARDLAAEVGVRVGGTGHAINYLVETEGMEPVEAERAMRQDSVGPGQRMLLHEIEQLKTKGWIVEQNGHLALGVLPQAYDPMRREADERREARRYSLRDARRIKGGWANWWNLDPSVVEEMKRDMQAHGWPKGLTVLLDEDGQVADGKHRVAAAEALGIPWRAHTRRISDEIALAEEVARRNAGRNWSMTPKQVASVAHRLSTDLGVVSGVEIARRTGVAKRTAQRATKEQRAEEKAERDDRIVALRLKTHTQAEIAKIVGVTARTVGAVLRARGVTGRIVKVEGNDTAAFPSTSEEPAPTPEPSRVEVGTCVVCGKALYEDEERGQVIQPKKLSTGKPALIAIPVRSGGGINKLTASYEKIESFGHWDCFTLVVQQHHRA